MFNIRWPGSSSTRLFCLYVPVPWQKAAKRLFAALRLFFYQKCQNRYIESYKSTKNHARGHVFDMFFFSENTFFWILYFHQFRVPSTPVAVSSNLATRERIVHVTIGLARGFNYRVSPCIVMSVNIQSIRRGALVIQIQIKQLIFKI